MVTARRYTSIEIFRSSQNEMTMDPLLLKGGNMEVAIFDRKGKPHAYIALNDENPIYLWNGRAVAYLDGKHVYGYNGRHLGWFEEGIIYDKRGTRIGFTEETCPAICKIEPIKSVKKVKRIKSVKHVAPVKPIFSIGYSSFDLSTYLKSGY